jgi:hypothetical protein
LSSGAVVAALALFPALASADLASEVAHGQQMAEAVRSGEQQCSDLSTDDFEAVGEYAMGQFLANPAAHEAMNAQMSRMMGASGEVAMHVSLGHRYTACPGGPSGNWSMPMAAMMNRSGSMMGSGSAPGWMGRDHDMSGWAIVVVGLGGALIGGALVLLGSRRRQPPEVKSDP